MARHSVVPAELQRQSDSLGKGSVEFQEHGRDNGSQVQGSVYIQETRDSGNAHSRGIWGTTTKSEEDGRPRDGMRMRGTGRHGGWSRRKSGDGSGREGEWGEFK